MPDFTNPESVMANYGLSLGALPALECMADVERICQSIRKAGIMSAEIERAFRLGHDEIWEKVQQVYAKQDKKVRVAPAPQSKPQPATVSPSADPFTSW